MKKEKNITGKDKLAISKKGDKANVKSGAGKGTGVIVKSTKRPKTIGLQKGTVVNYNTDTNR